jgi:DNA-directed RNA polymerase subunit RPC12/RpoP
MKKKKEIKITAEESKNSSKEIVYKCEKCGYESIKTFLNIFENTEYRFCPKCVHDFI